MSLKDNAKLSYPILSSHIRKPRSDISTNCTLNNSHKKSLGDKNMAKAYTGFSFRQTRKDKEKQYSWKIPYFFM